MRPSPRMRPLLILRLPGCPRQTSAASETRCDLRAPSQSFGRLRAMPTFTRLGPIKSNVATSALPWADIESTCRCGMDAVDPRVCSRRRHPTGRAMRDRSCRCPNWRVASKYDLAGRCGQLGAQKTCVDQQQRGGDQEGHDQHVNGQAKVRRLLQPRSQASASRHGLWHAVSHHAAPSEPRHRLGHAAAMHRRRRAILKYRPDRAIRRNLMRPTTLGPADRTP